MENQMTYRPAILDERQQAQKERIDLMKWKLIIAAAIGSAALGFFKGNGVNNAFSIIIFIPFCCVYVDLLCRKLSLRALKINIFLARFPEYMGRNVDMEFFKYYQDLNKYHNTEVASDHSKNNETKSAKTIVNTKDDSLESLALIGSSLFLTVLVTVAGYLMLKETWFRILFLISGVGCIVASISIDSYYQKNKNKILEKTKE